MKEYKTEQIRNIALVSHTGAGKTTFLERVMFDLNITTRMGNVQQGTTLLDFEEEEIERNSSVSAALTPIEYNGMKYNMLDTPGYIDFVGEVNAALRVADNAVVFVEAVGGVEVGTEVVWQLARQRNLPIAVVINKMDRDTVRTARAKGSVESNLKARFVDAQLPIGEGPSFTGVIDLISMKAYMGQDGKVADIPADMLDAAQEARIALVEAAAEGDDELMEKYFMEEPLTEAEVYAGLKSMMLRRDADQDDDEIVVPIFYCAGESGIGVHRLLDVFGMLMLAPPERGKFSAENESGEREYFEMSDSSPLAAFIFKTREDQYGKTSYIRVFGGVLESDTRVWDAQLDSEARVGSLGAVRGSALINVDRLHAGDIGAVVKLGDSHTNHTLCERSNKLKLSPTTQPDSIISVAIHPASQADVAKLNGALARLHAEDPTLITSYETATKEQILSGMGDVHLDIAVKKLKSKFGVNVTTTVPKIPYLETITRTNSEEYTHKKQTGGAGQYGRVFLRVESLENDEADVEFESEIFGGAISAPFVSATEKGVRAACEKGIIVGYPVKGMRCIVYDGKEHPVDSKEIAFQVAGRECVRLAVLGAGPVLLEPIYDVSVTVPSEYTGAVMSDMSPRRGHVHQMEQDGPRTTVKATVPLAEMQRYLVDLRSMTQGRGVYSMKFAKYGRVPSHMQEKIVEDLKHEEEYL